MKKFCVIFAVVIALCVTNFAQKKAADLCLSKDPKVRATAKKPCPSAPAPKKTKPVIPPKTTNDGETSDSGDDENSDDSPTNDKPDKNQKSPAKNKSAKPTDYLGTFFFITIIYKGEKTELANTQFEEGGGSASVEPSGRMNLFYGASNSKMNGNQFMFQGMIASPTIGTFALGNGVTFAFNTDRFPQVQIFLCSGGNYEIEAVPLKGGFVTGSFTVNCTGEINADGEAEKYSMSGKFKLLRQ